MILELYGNLNSTGEKTVKDKKPEKTIEICQKLLRGYQFSTSDFFHPGNASLYTILDDNFEWFQAHLSLTGFSLTKDQDVIFLEKELKVLSNEEKQSIVVIFLLSDLWMEKGKSLGDLFQLKIPWQELDWFRDGYGKDYLIQSGIGENNMEMIEDLFRKLSRKGIVEYQSDPPCITLRKPAERLINMARAIHLRIKTSGSSEENGKT
jgi:hypothetical protein